MPRDGFLMSACPIPEPQRDTRSPPSHRGGISIQIVEIALVCTFFNAVAGGFLGQRVAETDGGGRTLFEDHDRNIGIYAAC